jgi:FtsH-binding integral membrane protein
MISGGSFGLTGGYLIKFANYFDPTIVPLDVTVTVEIILAMTLITKYITDQQMAWLGGFIGSISSKIFMFSLFSMFVTVPDIVYDIRLFLELVVFCGCICFDTHKMREKIRTHFSSPINYYDHAMYMFIDIVMILRKIIKIEKHFTYPLN